MMHLLCAFLGAGETTWNRKGLFLHPSGKSIEADARLQVFRWPGLNPLYVSKESAQWAS